MNETPKWYFKELESDDTRRESVSNEFFKSTRLEAIVREAIQNSLDARSGNAPVHVRIYYSGGQAAIPGKDYAAKFRGIEVDQHYAHQKNGLVSAPAESEECEFLTIEDFNTTGLTGDVSMRPTEEELENDRVKGNYYNYFFSENRSGKNHSGALGSWGAGKIMFLQASRLKTAFTLSVRDDATTPRFLAGRFVLMSHSIDGKMYGPDGWFGISATNTHNDNNFMRKQPITDTVFIDSFSKMFHLERKPDEHGTSVVIPYLRMENDAGQSDFSKDSIVSSVMKNFLVSILNGELSVTVTVGSDEKVVKIDKDTVKTEKKRLPEIPDGKTDIVTRQHYDIASRLADEDFPEALSFTLKSQGGNVKSEWCDSLFEELDLKKIKKTLSNGKCVKFIVPINIQKRKAPPTQAIEWQNDSFVVAVKRVPDQVSFRTAYYRKGLLIDSVSKKTFSSYATLVRIDGDSSARMLVASEPPSHCSWESSAERVKNSYFNASQQISFVVNSVSAILSRIDAADQDPDWNPLAGSFGIPDDDNDPESQETKGKRDTPDTPQPDKPQPVPEPTPGQIPSLPEEILKLSKLQGKTGFTLTMKPDRKVEKGYPFSATYKMGYSPFSKTKWSKYDFDLTPGGAIAIALDDESQKDIVDVKGVDNRLILTIKKQGGFKLSVTGFDPNRDLEITRQKYDYSKAVPDVAVSSGITRSEGEV